ncbi:MAG: outer membrane lipoprotein carrier protein LolA [Fimbriimonas sp.]
MLTTLIAVVVAAQAQGGQVPQAAPTETAVQIIEKVLAKYAGAKTISGTVTFKQSASGLTARGETQLQFEKPSKIYLKQIYQGASAGDRREMLLVSDGKVFSYDKPDGTFGRSRFTEFVTQHGTSQSIQDMYTVERGRLADRSPLVDVAIGRTQDLKELLAQWASMKVHSVAKVKDREIEATAIVGDYRDNAEAAITGSFEVYVTKDYELVRYVTKYMLRLPQSDKPIEVLTVWDSDLKVNAQVNPALFRVIN